MSTNEEVYHTNRIVDVYRRTLESGLTGPEEFCFGVVPDAARGSILDIGIGAGRTLPPLSKMFRRYVGIDYSAPMIQAARKAFPGADVRTMDARELDFAEPFDCVFFSFNGISSVSFEDRQRIIEAVARALRAGGFFVYSGHSLNHNRVPVWMNCFWVRELFVPLERIRFIPNRLRKFRGQFADRAKGYAYVNDPGLGFSLHNTYVDMDMEFSRLRELGFSIVTTIGNRKQSPGYDADDNWVYIVVQKT